MRGVLTAKPLRVRAPVMAWRGVCWLTYTGTDSFAHVKFLRSYISEDGALGLPK